MSGLSQRSAGARPNGWPHKMAEDQKWRLSWGYWPYDLCCTVPERALWEQPVFEVNNASMMEKHQGVVFSHSQIHKHWCKVLSSSLFVFAAAESCSLGLEIVLNLNQLLQHSTAYWVYSLCWVLIHCNKRCCSLKCIQTVAASMGQHTDGPKYTNTQAKMSFYTIYIYSD